MTDTPIASRLAMILQQYAEHGGPPGARVDDDAIVAAIGAVEKRVAEVERHIAELPKPRWYEGDERVSTAIAPDPDRCPHFMLSAGHCLACGKKVRDAIAFGTACAPGLLPPDTVVWSGEMKPAELVVDRGRVVSPAAPGDAMACTHPEASRKEVSWAGAIGSTQWCRDCGAVRGKADNAEEWEPWRSCRRSNPDLDAAFARSAAAERSELVALAERDAVKARCANQRRELRRLNAKLRQRVGYQLTDTHEWAAHWKHEFEKQHRRRLEVEGELETILRKEIVVPHPGERVSDALQRWRDGFERELLERLEKLTAAEERAAKAERELAEWRKAHDEAQENLAEENRRAEAALKRVDELERCMGEMLRARDAEGYEQR